MTEQRVRRGPLKSAPQLEAAVPAWLDELDDDPKPSMWTKRVDVIPRMVEKHERIYDALR